MDARERLRQYLEQRRELGESEFVLDALPVEDVLRLLGDNSPAAERKPAGQAPRDAEPTAGRDRAAAPSGNWRDTLASIGAEAPATPAQKASSPSTAPTTAPRNAPTNAPAPADAPALPGTGLVVGSPMGELLPGALAHLATLDDVAKHVAGCRGCSLYQTAKNHVPGEGNPHAGFVCVGEAPGQTEDELGRPFVGRAGELLTKILEAIQFKREDVFICNVLKHRPPGNRNPAPDEIKACSPYLLRQLELLQPRVILALGTFASQTLLQTTQPIGKLRGLVHRYHGIPLIVTYHPAALLRNPAWKRPTWEDVQLARRIFDSAAQG
jgi:DNA polymerase